MFTDGFKKFMEIEDSHFRKSQKQRRLDNLQIEKYKNIY